MRIRQVKPDFWLDEKMAALTYGARLFYIGLWCVADDAGWMEWNIHRIGAELFPHESPKKREKNVGAWSGELVDAKRVEILECGHAVVPTLSEHQRLSGPTKRVLTYLRKHERGDCPIPAHPRTSPHIPAGEQMDDLSVAPHIPAVPRGSPHIPDTVRNGKERKGTVGNGSAGARDDQDQETEFQRKVPRPNLGAIA